MRPMTEEEEREIGPATRTGGATLPSSFTDGCHRRGKRHLGRKRKGQIGMGMRCFHLYIDLALEGERMGMKR